MASRTSFMSKLTSAFILLCFIPFLFLSAGCKRENKALPILGNQDVVNGDTIRHIVPDYLLTDQDSQQIRISGYGNKIFLADFFFISCPSICPKVQKQMLRLYDKYKDDNRVMLLSHTIDQRHDSVTVLHRYAQNLGIDTGKWKFLTAEKDSIFYLADQYFVSVVDDPSAPKGFDHSGRIILLDKNRHVRGFCEGTDPESVTAFFSTVDRLLAEEYK
ncbi:MAG: SCO family protein [Saprospiraceae bacterium]|uniref:SCO family protein n=1 Tax=Candidatus Opimibacter skivensis TaxID=2982028 RepID=A0A9D7XUY6_9BACT|nr:SCO family protein [Candidatus Opimibacter skivensis]